MRVKNEKIKRGGGVSTDASILQTEHKTERNIGIDALRLLSMFFVVSIHILGEGGGIEKTIGLSKGIAWGLKAVVYCAVDIYAIISGYVGYSKNSKPFITSKYISMWLQVFFYSFGITLIAFIIDPKIIGIKTLVKSIFPVSTNQYWYFTAFTGLFLLKTRINKHIQMATEIELTTFSLLILGMFSTYSTFACPLGGDPFVLSGGFSMLWLVLLYVIGAWVKRCNIVEYMSSKVAVILITICTFLTWVVKVYLSEIRVANALVSYVSPTILLTAIAYVCIFSKLRCGAKVSKIITCLAPAAFGVYLIHYHPVIWKYCFSKVFSWIVHSFGTWQMPIYIIGSAIAIFSVCIMIEKLRLVIFRVLGINYTICLLGKKIDCLLVGIRNRFVRWLRVDG